jgi:hypothetical protein
MPASEPLPPDTAAISNNREESGLWLWHGEAPAQSGAALPAPPPSGVRRIVPFVASAAHNVRGCLGPPGALALGLAVIGFAAWAMVFALSGGEPVPRKAAVAASAPLLSPSVATAASSTVPAVARPPQPEAVPALPPSFVQTAKERTERETIKPRVSHRWRHVKKARASFARTWTEEPCRYHCDASAEPMTWRGGGD